MYKNTITKWLFLSVLALTLIAGVAQKAEAAPEHEVYLRAEAFTKTMPDGTEVLMWGFAQDSSFEALDGEVSSPGPILEMPNGNGRLTVYLDNNLPVPTSVVVPGAKIRGAINPVRNADGRVRSFLHETEPGNTSPGVYTFAIRRGTYLYHSGSHLAVQVQMGLYGGIKRNVNATRAYPGTAKYQSEVVLFYSEIDPNLHDAIQNDQYGPGKEMTSTIEYHPQYFLVNGEAFSTADGFSPLLPAGVAGDRVLIRFFNAGIRTFAPTILGTRWSLIAEDGNKLPYEKDQSSLMLPALKTMDAFIVPGAEGDYAVFDRRAQPMDSLFSPGGTIRYLHVDP